MAMSFLANDHEDEEYIDMELSSHSNFFCNSITSPSHLREFEFQMSSASVEIEPTSSPADELFYKWKLLPLQLHHQKLLQNSGSGYGGDRNGEFEEIYGTPLATTTVTTPTQTSTSTPFESCNVSPSESCRVSGELNPEEYLLEYFPAEVSGSIGENPKKSWTRKLKLMKQSAMISSKLKASRAYLKSLLGKSGCSDESSASAARVGYGGGSSMSKAKERLDQHTKSAKQNPFGQIHIHQICTAAKLTDHQDNATNRHRRSFSMAIKRHSTNKSSSSSSSSSSGSYSSSSSSNVSDGFQYLQFLKRSTSVNAEIESPIQGAIAHCKQSQQAQQSTTSRNTVSEAGFYSLSASSIAVLEDQDRPDLCSG